MERKVACLDTSILIDYFRNKNKESTAFYKLSDLNYSLAVTSITTFEIYRGVNSLQQAFWDNVFSTIEVIPFEEQASKIAASILQSITKKNNQIALPDLFIAAIAIQNNLKLVTLNIKDFAKVDALELLVDFG